MRRPTRGRGVGRRLPELNLRPRKSKATLVVAGRPQKLKICFPILDRKLKFFRVVTFGISGICGDDIRGRGIGLRRFKWGLAVGGLAFHAYVDCTTQRNARNFVTAGTSVLLEHQLNCFPDGLSTVPTVKDYYN